MKIIYVSSLISKNKMNGILNDSKDKPLQSIQRYHRLICEGLVDNECTVQTISAIPVSSKISSKKVWFEQKEVINSVKYQYLPFINIPILRQLCLFVFTIIFLIKELSFYKEKTVVVCDVLNTTISMAALFISKIFGVLSVGIVTDLPCDMKSSNKLSRKINEKLEGKYDSYIILTKYMNKIINKEKKPFIVIEGICDIIKNSYVKASNNEKYIMYAGGLYERYGLKVLIDGFIEAQIKDLKLYICGSGDMEEYIKSLNNDNIIYMGTISNDEVLELEKKALLLVNPRFSNNEYTKYSFPSKNIEYMSTGTPVLTTKLKGIPDEYYKYCYTIDKETKEGVKKSLKSIFNSKKTNENIGLKAQEFVVQKKNKTVQAKKIVNFINKILLTKNTCPKSNKFISNYAKFYLFICILLSRNTLYTSIYLGFKLSFYIIAFLSVPLVLNYIRSILRKEYNRKYLLFFIVFALSMLLSCVIKKDFALYNITNIASICIAFVFSQSISLNELKKSFVLIICILCACSLVNLLIIRPILLNNNINPIGSPFYQLNSAGTPFVNCITSFVVWTKGYNRNFSIFTEPSFFQFYILVALVFVLFSKYKKHYKIIGFILLCVTILTTESTSGIVVLLLFMLGYFLCNMKKAKFSFVGLFILLLGIIVFIKYDYFRELYLKTVNKLFNYNASSAARVGSITLAFDNFIRNPIFGNSIIAYLSTMNITNTLPSMFAIYGLFPGIMLGLSYILFSKNNSNSKYNTILILIVILLSTSSHFFLGVTSFWFVLFGTGINYLKE